MDYARDLAAKLVIEAEKFKGEVAKAKGKALKNLIKCDAAINNRYFLRVDSAIEEGSQVLDDDDFFHVTCHIDKQLADKIEKGGFVDLEKFLLKDRSKK